MIKSPRLAHLLVLAFMSFALAMPGLMVPSPAMAESEPTQSRRILSVGGSITEILYELGLEDEIVAVDTTSVYPASALKEKPNVGYMRRLNAEGVLSVNPGIILAEFDAGPQEVIDILKSGSIPFITLPAAFSGQGIVKKIRLVGEAIGEVEKAEKLAKRVEAELEATQTLVEQIADSERKKVLFVLSTRGGRMMVGGSNSHASAAIEMAGGVNLMQSIEGYKAVDNEALLSNPPEVIVAMNHRAMTTGADELANHTALKNSPAVKNGRIIRMDGSYLLGFGPRTAFAVADLARHLYPDHPALKDLPKRDFSE